MLLMREDVIAVADFGAAHAAINTVLSADDEITTAYVRSPERILGETVSLASGDVGIRRDALVLAFWELSLDDDGAEQREACGHSG